MFLLCGCVLQLIKVSVTGVLRVGPPGGVYGVVSSRWSAVLGSNTRLGRLIGLLAGSATE